MWIESHFGRRRPWGLGTRPRPARIALAALVVVALPALLSCSGDGTTPGQPGDLSALLILGGEGQSGVVGEQLAQPLRVQALDDDDNPIAGQIVNFVVVSGGGSVFAGAASTNSEGIAQELWTLGTSTAALQRVEVRAVDPETGAPIVFGVYEATPLPDDAVAIAKNAGDAQTSVAGSPVTDSLAVRAVDQYGNPVPSVSVSWAAGAGNGSVNPASASTGPTGIARTKWTLGTGAGAQSATATATGLTGSPLSFGATGVAGAATQIASNGGSTTGTAGTAVAVPPSVIVRDANNNPVSGVSVTFAVTAGGGSVTGAALATNAAGIAQVASWTLGTVVGSNTLSATVSELTPVSFSVTSVAAAAAKLGLITAPSASAPSRVAFAQQPVLQLQDAHGNAVAQSVNVTAVISSGTGSLSGTTTVSTDGNGIATFTNLSIAAQAGTKTLAFQSSGLTEASANVQITFGAPTQFIPREGLNQQAEVGTAVSIPLVVQIADADNNYVEGATVNFAVTQGGGSVSDPTAVTGADGRATQNGTWTLGSAGTNNVTVTITGVQGSAVFDAHGWLEFKVSEISAGSAHSCATSLGGDDYCWGANRTPTGGNQFGGQLGINQVAGLRSVPTAVVGGFSFATIVAGGTHTCGVSTTSVVFCWGRNVRGQIGDGTNNIAVTPSDVPGFSFSSVAVGNEHTCALTPTNRAYCWGMNDNGQLGIGTQANSGQADVASPVAVLGDLEFTRIAAGSDRTCALTAADVAYCWGNSQPTPNVVAGAPPFEQIVAGSAHTCARTSAGVAYCWGSNSSGQLGDGTVTSRSTPTLVAGGHQFVTLTADANHTCGLTAAGVAYCWGWNSEGKIGDGTTTNRLTPTAVAGGLTFKAISAGGRHTCAIASNDTAYCWGQNLWGEIGDNGGASGNGPTNSVGNPRLTPVKVHAP